MFRDTIITARSKRRELRIFLACFLLAFLINIIGIIRHGTPLRELFTQLHIVLLLSAIFYVLAAVLRLLYLLASRLWNRD